MATIHSSPSHASRQGLWPLGLALAGLGVAAIAHPAQAGVPAAGASGISLYGEAPQPNVLHNEYVVFQQANGKVVGAIYQPRSEFSCFAGSLQQQRLKGQTVEPEAEPPASIGLSLSALNPITTPSANDKRILSACKQEMAQQIRQGQPSKAVAALPAVLVQPTP